MQLLAPAIKFVADALTFVVGWIVKAIDYFVQLVTGSKTASAQFMAAFNGVGEFFGNLICGVVKTFTALPGLIGNALAGLGGMLTDIGRNMIQGLINGASSLLGNLSSFVSNLVSRYIVGPVKSLLGIHSPSRVFAEIGGYTMAGLEIGLSDTSGVRNAVDSLGKELASTVLPAPRVSSVTVRPSELAARNAADRGVVSQMSAADRAFFTELFRDFAGSLVVTDGVIAQAARAANARLVRAGATR